MAVVASEQQALLQGCLNNIGHQSHLMKQCLNEGNLLQALKHCSNFLNELRINQLSPKQYYEMYVVIFDALETLSSHLLASHKSKQKKRASGDSPPFLADLYELVQYSGNIIPRLYMMIVVGTTYMSTDGAPKKELMKEMIEMCRGVQHPIRGLFLRYYLSQRIKDLLPLSNDNDLNETVEFLMSNFIEMNKLWVRLQHQGHSSERELRFRERKELKILVGSNLVRLSQIIDDYTGDDEYSSINYYKEKIFPVITEHIIQCRDPLAQSYLIDVLIQIFPDNFHFVTLDKLLSDVFINLHPMLKKSELVSSLIERFITYRKYENDLDSKVENLDLNDKAQSNNLPLSDVFDIFWAFYLKLFETDPELAPEEHSTMLQSFIQLSLAYDLQNFENLNQIYKFASEQLSNDNETQEDQQLWLNLLTSPLQHFSSVKSLLSLSYFYEFYSKLSNIQYKKLLALEVLTKVLTPTDAENNIFDTYSTVDEIDMIFKYLLILIKDTDSQKNTAKDLGVTKAIKIDGGEKSISHEFLRVQENLGKVVHLIENNDYFKNISNLMYIRKKYLSRNPDNILYTYPALISKILNQLRIIGLVNLRKSKADSNKDLLITTNFKNLSVIIDELYQHHQQFNLEVVLKLYLNAAAVADQLKQESIAYELFTQCFIVYEENVIFNSTINHSHNPHDSIGGSLPFELINMIANKLANLRYFNKENYENLITKLTLYGSKLLKKHAQCRAVYYCAHLWWWCDLFIEGSSPTVEVNPPDEEAALYRDAKRVLECLQKALRVADSCMDPYLSLKLFVEILNRCLIFNIYGNHLIDSRYINGLIDLIRTNLENFRDDNASKDDDDHESRLFNQIQAYFHRTLHYIEEQKYSEDRFQDIIV